ncbi:hypothetical protein KY023_003279 [Vibrio vulnificus]|nr:hypothetical protein [Vibrio vulnificus]
MSDAKKYTTYGLIGTTVTTATAPAFANIEREGRLYGAPESLYEHSVVRESDLNLSLRRSGIPDSLQQNVANLAIGMNIANIESFDERALNAKLNQQDIDAIKATDEYKLASLVSSPEIKSLIEKGNYREMVQTMLSSGQLRNTGDLTTKVATAIQEDAVLRESIRSKFDAAGLTYSTHTSERLANMREIVDGKIPTDEASVAVVAVAVVAAVVVAVAVITITKVVTSGDEVNGELITPIVPDGEYKFEPGNIGIIPLNEQEINSSTRYKRFSSGEGSLHKLSPDWKYNDRAVSSISARYKVPQLYSAYQIEREKQQVSAIIDGSIEAGILTINDSDKQKILYEVNKMIEEKAMDL